MFGSYLCPDCAHESDEPICPMCNTPTERIDDIDDVTGESLEERENKKYPLDELKKFETEEDLDIDENNEENKEL